MDFNFDENVFDYSVEGDIEKPHISYLSFPCFITCSIVAINQVAADVLVVSVFIPFHIFKFSRLLSVCCLKNDTIYVHQ